LSLIFFGDIEFHVIFLHTGIKTDSDVTFIENDSESKGNNDKEWDKDFSPSSEEDSISKNNGVGMTEVSVHALTRVIGMLGLNLIQPWPKNCKIVVYCSIN
jgi:hypothetical protein